MLYQVSFIIIIIMFLFNSLASSWYLLQQEQSHMDREHFPTRDPSTGTGSLAALELWKKRTHSKDT